MKRWLWFAPSNWLFACSELTVSPFTKDCQGNLFPTSFILLTTRFIFNTIFSDKPWPVAAEHGPLLYESIHLKRG